MKDKYLVLVYSDSNVSQHFYEYDSLDEAKVALYTLKTLKESQYGFSNSSPVINPIKSLKLVKVTEVL